MSSLPHPITLSGKLCTLRPLQTNDIVHFKPLVKDPETWRYFTSDLSDEPTLKHWVQTAIDEMQNRSRAAFTLIELSTNKIAGSTSLGNYSSRDGRIEIGWTWLGGNFRGRGLNDEAKQLLLEYCFEHLNIERVEFKTDVLNLHARQSLQRIGATEEGILRSHTQMTFNRRRDTIYYSILRDEWCTRRSNQKL